MIALISSISDSDMNSDTHSLEDNSPLLRCIKEKIIDCNEKEDYFIYIYVCGNRFLEENNSKTIEQQLKNTNSKLTVKFKFLKEEKRLQFDSEITNLSEMISYISKKNPKTLYFNTQSGTAEFKAAIDFASFYYRNHFSFSLVRLVFEPDFNKSRKSNLLYKKDLSFKEDFSYKEDIETLALKKADSAKDFFNLPSIKAGVKIRQRYFIESLDHFRFYQCKEKVLEGIKSYDYSFAYDAFIDLEKLSPKNKEVKTAKRKIKSFLDLITNPAIRNKSIENNFISAQIFTNRGDFFQAEESYLHIYNDKSFSYNSKENKQTLNEMHHNSLLISNVDEIKQKLTAIKNSITSLANKDLDKENKDLISSINKIKYKKTTPANNTKKKAVLIGFVSNSEPVSYNKKNNCYFSGPIFNIFQNLSSSITDVYFILSNLFLTSQKINQIREYYSKTKKTVKLHFFNYNNLQEITIDTVSQDVIDNNKYSFNEVYQKLEIFYGIIRNKIGNKRIYLACSSGMPKMKNAFYPFMQSIKNAFCVSCINYTDYYYKKNEEEKKDNSSYSKDDYSITEEKTSEPFTISSFNTALNKALDERNYHAINFYVREFGKDNAITKSEQLTQWSSYNLNAIYEDHPLLSNNKDFKPRDLYMINKCAQMELLYNDIKNKNHELSSKDDNFIATNLLAIIQWVCCAATRELKEKQKDNKFIQGIDTTEANEIYYKNSRDNISIIKDNFAASFSSDEKNAIGSAFLSEGKKYSDFFGTTATLRGDKSIDGERDISTNKIITPLLMFYNLLDDEEGKDLYSLWCDISKYKHPIKDRANFTLHFLPGYKVIIKLMENTDLKDFRVYIIKLAESYYQNLSNIREIIFNKKENL